jgi:hypothetical protein
MDWSKLHLWGMIALVPKHSTGAYCEAVVNESQVEEKRASIHIAYRLQYE